MRMLVFFDLPVVTKSERRAYTVFRRFLLNDGYDMIQFSVYGRILNGGDAADKHMKRLLMAIQENLAKYEQKFGPVEIIDPGTPVH